MNSDIAHWLVTAGTGAMASLLWWLFTTTRKDQQDRIVALELQNANQERELATLKATQGSHQDGFSDVKAAIQRMDNKIDQVMMALGRKPTPYTPSGR